MKIYQEDRTLGIPVYTAKGDRIYQSACTFEVPAFTIRN